MIERPYTHIVVGAGSAGCVVTARLVENSNFNVLLIEAGPDYGDKTPSGMASARRVPMQGQTDVFDKDIDWNLEVNVLDATMTVPQAKVMGGGSSINGGTALRNGKVDSKEWIALGNPAWSFEDVLPVYESMEDDDVRGHHGPHPIQRVTPEETGKIQKAFINGAIESGFKYVLDQNEPGAEGVSPSPVCRRADKRISSANTYIDPIRSKPNLTILSDLLVDRVFFEDNQAAGVLVDGKKIHANEIILCAGAIFTPAILQRSGVGPTKVLSKLNIHKSSTYLSVRTYQTILVYRLLPNHTQIHTQRMTSLYNAMLDGSSSISPNSIDLQLVCFSYLYTPEPDPRVQHGRSLAGMISGHVSGIGCNINKPTSLGLVEIRSRDATEQPTVTPEYLSTDHDKKLAREVVRKGYQVMQTSSMQSVMGPPFGLEDSDEALDTYIQAQVTSTYHFCGSCRMANRDNDGVVDQSGRVYGVEGLRVADASVIPTVPAANTMWTTMMFAERIGRSIRDGKVVG